MKKSIALLLALVMLLGLSVQAASAEEARTDLNLTLNQAIVSLNPYESTAIVDIQLFNQVYETLFFVDDSGALVPRIADSYEVQADNRTYYVKLHDGIRFQNGKPVTAEDVAWSVDYGFVSGPYMAARSLVGNVDSAWVVDENTVAIKCTNVDASFIGKLSTYGFIVCKEAFLAAKEAGTLGIEWVPYGSGPYTVTKYNPDSEIELAANEDYWRGPARIKTVHYQILSDNNTISVAFEAGDLDFIVVPTAKWASISSNPDYNTYLSPTNHTSFFILNVNNGDALSNKLVRQAISYGMDRESMVIAAYDGIATPAYSMFNPDTVFGGFRPEELEAAGISSYQYDPEKAVELLKEAGYPDGVDIGTITCINGSYWEKMSTVFQANMQDIGIKVAIELLDSATCRANRKEHAYQLTTTGLSIAVEGTSTYFYYRLLTPEQIAAGDYTETGISDPELDAMYNKVMNTLDQTERKAQYLELNRMLQDDQYIIPTFHKAIPYAYAKDLVCDAINTNYYHIYEFHWN